MRQTGNTPTRTPTGGPRATVDAAALSVKVALAAALAAAWLLAACSPSVTREPVPTPSDNLVATDRVCDMVHSADAKSMATAAMEGRITDFSRRQGVPSAIGEAVDAYYDEPKVRVPDVVVAGQLKEDILRACRDHDWRP